jgi:ribose 5-phosphate isomerase B
MLAIGSDHGGFALKREIIAYLEENKIEYKDFGAYTTESCDYPVYGEKAARAVASGECGGGILVCGTGIGISIAANKVAGVRAALCGDCFSAEMTRRHNDANVLCLGGRVTGTGLAIKIVEIFLNTTFEGGRHKRRVDMLGAIAP